MNTNKFNLSIKINRKIKTVRCNIFGSVIKETGFTKRNDVRIDYCLFPRNSLM